MHTGLLNVLHHAADQGFAGHITDTVHIALNGVVEESVQQHWRVVADLDSFAHVTLEVALLVHDFHGAAAQYVARAHDQRITKGRCFFKRLGFGAGRRVGWLAQLELVQ